MEVCSNPPSHCQIYQVPLDEKLNLPQICLVQICCKYEICKALQPVQRWQSPNLHVFVQIRPLPPLHWLQSFANFIFATYLHQANLMQIRFFVLCSSVLSKFMACVKTAAKCGRVFKNFSRWFAEKRKSGINYSFRFTGLKSKKFSWNFCFLIETFSVLMEF